MAPAKILIVDDDPAVRNLIDRFLSTQGYVMQVAADGQQGLILFASFQPDLVILDVNLPDSNGYTLCQTMQQHTGVLVLMLTSRDDESDKLEGFRQGADDYITKPFILSELGARVAAILKRQRSAPSPPPSSSLNLGPLALDPVQREARIGADILPFTALEFDLLYFLSSHPDRVWRRSELIQAVWDYDHVGDQRVVDVHIGQIRKKIDKVTAPDFSATLIKTVRGVGYKLSIPKDPRTVRNP
ncbi:response regulator transcription factor [Prochlorothrix hollandica]|uniref:Transcriptional regulator n=1 Tax=Prochlorothrix hollandica PCC 9006 = CALU 1027 TaxID=317619 RepID=A0A0M2PPG2_PROHO|nr:response regulator transcription factor [Prochlorothrix hollandica]KKI98149.1 transcriptional regulator [Prochlorothrix hollandica PCC 9006 = CALU 1027]